MHVSNAPQNSRHLLQIQTIQIDQVHVGYIDLDVNFTGRICEK